MANKKKTFEDVKNLAKSCKPEDFVKKQPSEKKTK